MRLLLDTNIFIWWTEDSPKLYKTIRDAIADPVSELYLSTASVWEIVIKHQLGKLTFPEPLDQTIPHAMAHYGLGRVPIELTHLFKLHQLPPHHRDPFDRLIFAQALFEGFTLATSDALARNYNVPLLL